MLLITSFRVFVILLLVTNFCVFEGTNKLGGVRVGLVEATNVKENEAVCDMVRTIPDLNTTLNWGPCPIPPLPPPPLVTTPPPCNWTGITCNTNFSIVMLNLSNYFLYGYLPDSIGNFEFLTSLNIGNTDLTGTIPETIGNLSRLSSLEIQGNSFTGTLPRSIARLTALTKLSLGDNNLVDLLPDEIGKLSKLSSLDIHKNTFFGTLPTSLRGLSLLTYLDLSSNFISGDFPALFGSLSHINLHDNFFTGTPFLLHILANLTFLDISNNGFSGTLPTQLSNIKPLQDLNLELNNFCGSITSEINKFTSLKKLSIAKNSITGSIPTQIGQLKNLTFLNLSANQLIGTIPSQIGNLSSLIFLSISFNDISGAIPDQFGKLRNLSAMNAFFNYLDVQIPSSLGMLSSLTNLDLSLNNIPGTIPNQLSNLNFLAYLSLTGNHLVGTIPSRFGRLKRLTKLNLRSNFISGTIPPQLTTLDQLKYLDLRRNLISGTLPYLGKMYALTYLDLSMNTLEGTFPSEFSNLILYHIDMSQNKFSGTIPSMVGRGGKLVYLDVSSNLLSGTFPEDVVHNALEYISLANNSFSGTLPSLFVGWTGTLYELYLNDNNFSGTIQNDDFSKFQNLKTVALQNNKFSGNIPQSLVDLNSLVNLYLNANNFTGVLPTNWSKSIVVLDLSGIKVCGCLPNDGRQWASCDLTGVFHNCACFIDQIEGCSSIKCDDTIECGIDQCLNQTHQCKDNRECIYSNYGYTCGNCRYGSISLNRFECINLFFFVGIPSGFIVFIFLVLVGCLIRSHFKKPEVSIEIPYKWFWDPSRRTKGYVSSSTEPLYFSKKINLKSTSKEKKWLDELVAKLDFGNIIIDEAYAVVSPILALSASNTRKILKQRMSGSPNEFFNQSWKKTPERPQRERVMELFLSKVYNWDWNKNLSIENAPVVPVVHGTDETIAWKIATSGFASLSLLDSGYYGKGIYFSTSATYIIPYFGTKKNPSILICLAIPGNPYPVVESPQDETNWCGKVIHAGCQSHYVATTKKGLPMTEEKYENGETPYDELVLQQDAQVTPIFILNIGTQNLMKLILAFQRDVLVVKLREEGSEHRTSLLTRVSGSLPTPKLISRGTPTTTITNPLSTSLSKEILPLIPVSDGPDGDDGGDDGDGGGDGGNEGTSSFYNTFDKV